jgi:tetratricopeptide (TPR) repeat protein
MNRQPIALFYSYAHTATDERFQQQLERRLALLQRDGVIDTWHFRKIVPGADWKQAIDHHLRKATLILLLISPDFIASNDQYDIEMKQAMEQQRKGESRVLPIIIRPVDWSSTPFARLQTLPLDTRPVAAYPNRDDVYQEITECIKGVIDEWFSSRTIEEWIDKADMQSNLEDMLWCVRQVLRIDQNHLAATLLKGRILRWLEYFDEALETVDSLLQSSPTCMIAYAEKVRILKFTRRYQEALDVCEQASQRDPQFAPIYYLKADILIKDGRYHEALRLSQKSIDLDKNDGEAYAVQGAALAQLDHLKEALVGHLAIGLRKSRSPRAA